MSKVKIIRAFSLIELSILILIIGVIIVGIIGGKKLITLSNLSKARALTNSSPVAGIEDLALWLETTSKNSFNGVQTDSTDITAWKDINPQKNVKVAITITDAPQYVENGINGLPALKIDGVADSLSFNESFINGSDLSVFVVDKIEESNCILCYVLADPNNNSCIAFRYSALPGTVAHAMYLTNADNPEVVVLPGSFLTPRISSMVFTIAGGAPSGSILVNGVSSTAAANPGLPNCTTGNIGSRDLTAYYKGNIGEIIIFTRALSTFERQQVEQYLAKKWSIKLT